jgi:hypothetical protein
VVERCAVEDPPLEPIAPDHLSACWVAGTLGRRTPAELRA